MRLCIGLLVVLVTGCGSSCGPAVPESTILACRQACDPRGLKLVTLSRCECQNHE